MDSNIQIQSLKSQIENIKLQIDNIEIQNNNLFMMNNNSISEQLLNLSIQILNAGVQAFNVGKNMNMMMNMQNFYFKLKKISEEINSIINGSNMEQFQLMQQQMMQQMQNQIMMQQQVQAQNKIFKYNVEFARFNGIKNNLVVNGNITVEELLNKYLNKYYGQDNGRIKFLFNAKDIKRNEKRTVENFFRYVTNSKIIVNEF